YEVHRARPDYELFTSHWSTIHLNSFCPHLHSHADWNMALTSACLFRHNFGAARQMALAIQQGATRCHACTDSIKRHKQRCGYHNACERIWSVGTNMRIGIWDLLIAIVA